jgi:Tfp pilus assembly protein PilF
MEVKQPERAKRALRLVRAKNRRRRCARAPDRCSFDLDLGPEAEPHLAEPFGLRPDNAEAHWRLALVRASQGRLVDALPEFAEAVRLNSTSAPMRNDYGWALAQHGQVAAGITQIQQALVLKADFVDAHRNLGHCWPRRAGSRRHFHT